MTRRQCLTKCPRATPGECRDVAAKCRKTPCPRLFVGNSPNAVACAKDQRACSPHNWQANNTPALNPSAAQPPPHRSGPDYDNWTGPEGDDNDATASTMPSAQASSDAQLHAGWVRSAGLFPRHGKPAGFIIV